MPRSRKLSSKALEREALAVVARLRRAGYKTYFAGGCVRDRLLGLAPEEYDIATSATPDEVEKLFKKTVAVGKAFGVVRVRRGGAEFEVATFRRDLPYRDGRHPEGVRFTSAEEDARRRDFSLNGLFYDPARKRVLDFVGGRDDLKRGLLRAIGRAEERFEEDKLRLLRAVRFAVRFGFRVESKTLAAIKRLAPRVVQVSAERIRDELLKIFLGPRPHRALDLLDETGLLEAVLPEISSMKGVEQPPAFHPEGDVYTHTRLMLEIFGTAKKFRSESKRRILVMAALLHDVGKPPTFEPADPRERRGRIRFDGHAPQGAEMAAAVMRRLKLPTRDIEAVAACVRDHLKFIDVFRMRPSTLKRLLRAPHFTLLLELHRIDCLASHGKLDAYRFCLRKRREFAKEDSLKPPRLLAGGDLIALGYAPGPRFKEILAAVETEQLEGRVRTPDEARAFVKRTFKRKTR
ncbi:MAG: CCA tRNA nucleotidyltransferase [Acidobacteriota bacterium]|nr:MAG: CCA tRNA nucleotidyltransferase [Acidobacteriota bacterium]